MHYHVVSALKLMNDNDKCYFMKLQSKFRFEMKFIKSATIYFYFHTSSVKNQRPCMTLLHLS